MKPPAAPTATFSPSLSPIRPAPRADLLGRFVPTSIGRVPPIARVKRPLRVALYGLATAGIAPLLFLRSRIHQYITLEHQQLELASELIACHLSPSDAKVVADAAARVYTPAWLRMAGDVTMLGAVIAIIATWQQYDFAFGAFRRIYFHPPTAADPLALAWMGLLTASYLLAHVRINTHIARLQQFVLAFNAATEKRAAPIPAPQLTWGLRPVNLIIAGIMMSMWSLWFLPMMLAWGAYANFVFDRDYPFRTELADRLQKLSGVSPVVDRAGLCSNPRCGQPLPDTASFCPRCGKKV